MRISDWSSDVCSSDLPSHLTRIALDLFMSMGLVLSPVIGLFMVFSVAGSIVQNPPRFTPEKIVPDIAKLNPLSGLKKMFSLPTVVEFVKNVLKITLIGIILFALIWPELDSLEELIDLDITLLIPKIGRASWRERVCQYV